MPIIPGFAAAGMDQNYLGEHWDALTYESMRPGCYRPGPTAGRHGRQQHRGGAELSRPSPASAARPSWSAATRTIGLACIQAYNDWMIDEWCAGDGYGRLIPLTLVPLWDPQLAADEVRRCAAKGSHAIAFSENPTKLKLPSIHTGPLGPVLRGLRGDRLGGQPAHRLVLYVSR